MKYYVNKNNKIAKAPSSDNNRLYTKEEILKFVQWLISSKLPTHAKRWDGL